MSHSCGEQNWGELGGAWGKLCRSRGPPNNHAWARLELWLLRCRRSLTHQPFDALAVAWATVRALRGAIQRDWTRASRDLTRLEPAYTEWFRGRDPALDMGVFQDRWAHRGVLCAVQGRRLQLRLSLDAQLRLSLDAPVPAPAAGPAPASAPEPAACPYACRACCQEWFCPAGRVGVCSGRCRVLCMAACLAAR